LLDFLGIAIFHSDAKSINKRPPLGGLSQLLSLFAHANDTLRRDCRNAKASPAKPISIIAHVEGSGIAPGTTPLKKLIPLSWGVLGPKVIEV
jgi:hypothetical protein